MGLGEGRGGGKKGKVEDGLLEALALLDRNRKMQKRQVISSFALRPSQEARGGGGRAADRPAERSLD